MMNDRQEQAEAVEMIAAYLKQTEEILTNLFQSGFDAVHESTLEGMGAAAASGRQYGMEALADMLEQLKQLLAARRHQFRGENRQACEIYGKLNQYLEICTRQLEVSRAAYRLGIGGGKEDAQSK